MFSIFDIFKIGVGPSSSHTNGPMLAGHQFSQKLPSMTPSVARIKIDLYGSLSLTGRGHHTDKAIILGLLGHRPDTIDIQRTNQIYKTSVANRSLRLYGAHSIHFNSESDIVFHSSNLPKHENGMSISAFSEQNELLEKEIYYSVGGGFIVTESEFENGAKCHATEVEFPFKNAEEMLNQAEINGYSLGGLILRNELAFRSDEEISQMTDLIWHTITSCVNEGLRTEGILEGGLNVTRRAAALLKQLEANQVLTNDPMEIMDWVNAYAFAASEQNAAGGKVVTSPTNGASGVIPAVLMYYNQFIQQLETKQLRDFFAVAGAIGMLYKMNASISGAEVGCQGEIGVSTSMAAAGLTSLRGGSNEQICVAAEIAMEHSLGMTCDPIAGLVQVPCIERNAMGAIKAINASRMALKRTSNCLISLDKVVSTMYQTGKDMNKKYRETSLGGLAIIHIGPPCE
jgi:L-serine dehydratase